MKNSGKIAITSVQNIKIKQISQKSPHQPLISQSARALQLALGIVFQMYIIDKVNQAETKADGQYMLAKIPSTKARQFSKSPRESLVLKQLLSTPGPGN
jgi:hypothetical protein